MRPQLVRFAIWLLRVAGESPGADRIVLLENIEDIHRAQERLARVRGRLERLDAVGDNFAHANGGIDEA